MAQHFSAWESNRKTMRADVFRDFSRRLKEEDAHLEELLGMARANDRQAIRKYLDANYQTNSMYARFCMKGK